MELYNSVIQNYPEYKEILDELKSDDELTQNSTPPKVSKFVENNEGSKSLSISTIVNFSQGQISEKKCLKGEINKNTVNEKGINNKLDVKKRREIKSNYKATDKTNTKIGKRNSFFATNQEKMNHDRANLLGDLFLVFFI